jgi:tripartite-type tricarboxylate transporter receptor subunit TctC
MRNTAFLMLIGLCSLVNSAFAAEVYPSRPIHLIVPYPAGGTADVMARALGQGLMASFGQPIIVDNRPGADTIIGAEVVAHSPPDGYTLLFATDSTLATNSLLHNQLPYDPQKDFVAITEVGEQNFVLVVNPLVPAKDLDEFVALAKARPGALNYGSFGRGSQPHLAMELFARLAGITLTHVPSKGVSGLLNDLMSGTVEAGFVGVSGANLINDGKVHGLAIDGNSRSQLFSQVPTFAEKGYPQMYARAWWGIVTTAGTPRAVLDKLNIELNRMINDPQFQQKYMLPQGLEPAGKGSDAFKQVIDESAAHWAKAIEFAGLKAE